MTTENSLPNIRRQRLAEWMSNKDMSRTDLAKVLGVGRAYTSLLFNPERSFGAVAARTIERALFMPTHYLDELGNSPTTVANWEEPSSLPDDVYALVPQVGVSLAAGAGAEPGLEPVLPPLAFRRSWLQSRGVTSRGNLRVASVRGDSMQPYLQDNDIVLLDMGQTDIVDNQIYAIEHSGDVRVKRLTKKFDGGILIRSDNRDYPEESLSPEQAGSLRTLGRVLWRAG